MTENFAHAGDLGWIAPPEGWLGSVRAAQSLRRGGTSLAPYDSLNLGRSAGDDPDRIAANEERLAVALGLPSAPARARLAHGTTCVTVGREGTCGPCDGLLTSRPGLPLWLTVADCVPVFLTAGDWIGLVHCGWRGTAAGAGAAIVRALADASETPPDRMRAWLGAGIGPCCYRVGPEVATLFPSGALRATDGAVSLDLHAAIRRDLASAGVPEEAVSGSGLCTSCRPDLFFSYRRDGARSGRMAAVLWRPTAAGSAPYDPDRIER